MKIKQIVVFALFLNFGAPLSLSAQSVVNMNLVQNPVFSVSTNEVSATIDSSPLTLGADVVITGGSGVYTYRWYMGDIEIHTNPTLTVKMPGDYYLDVKDQCDCVQTIVFHVSPSSGVNSVELGKVVQTTIFNAKGQLVRVVNGDNQDLPSLPKGIYVVNRVDEKGTIETHKIKR